MARLESASRGHPRRGNPETPVDEMTQSQIEFALELLAKAALSKAERHELRRRLKAVEVDIR